MSHGLSPHACIVTGIVNVPKSIVELYKARWNFKNLRELPREARGVADYFLYRMFMELHALKLVT